MAEETTGFWCVLEQMGHKKLAGYATEVTLAGHGFLRIDIPSDDPAKWSATQFISPASGSIYALTPVSEEVARAAAKRNQPEPVTQWELPQIEHRGRENGSSDAICTVVQIEDGQPVQCGDSAYWNDLAQNFRCEKHGGCPL